MTQTIRYPLDKLRGLVGQEVGLSRWFALPQESINQFADLTEDWQFIHVDPERAKAETPFGGAIAHGFFTLSMLSAMAYDAAPGVEGAVHGVNYGFDRMRFVSPVPAGSKIRGRFVLKTLDDSKPGEVSYTHEVTVEIEGQERPAIVADWLGRAYLGDDAA